MMEWLTLIHFNGTISNPWSHPPIQTKLFPTSTSQLKPNYDLAIVLKDSYTNSKPPPKQIQHLLTEFSYLSPTKLSDELTPA